MGDLVLVFDGLYGTAKQKRYIAPAFNINGILVNIFSTKRCSSALFLWKKVHGVSSVNVEGKVKFWLDREVFFLYDELWPKDGRTWEMFYRQIYCVTGIVVVLRKIRVNGPRMAVYMGRLCQWPYSPCSYVILYHQCRCSNTNTTEDLMWKECFLPFH